MAKARAWKENSPKKLKSRLESSLSRKGYRFIIGIDEAGRGPLAGPVVAAAVHLIDRRFHFPIRDSKIISARQRIEAFHEIHAKACVGVGIMNESIIDQQNILQATFLAMSRAVEELMVKLSTRQSEEVFDHQVMLLVDGNRFQSTLAYPYQTIVDGDASVLSIACASIVAKVVRDRILAIYDRVFPQYGFISHKGYPTQRHKEALKRYGPSVIHRRSFTLT